MSELIGEPLSGTLADSNVAAESGAVESMRVSLGMKWNSLREI